VTIQKQLKVVPNSGNAKLGPGVAATYRPVGETCPQDCTLLGNGCYAQRARVNIAQRRSAYETATLDKAAGAPLIRHHVSGDAFRADKLDRGYVRSLFSWHKRAAQKHTIGWTYTHRAQDWTDAGYGPETHPEKLAVLASCADKKTARSLRKIGWRTARVSEKRDADKGEVYCPYDFAKDSGTAPKTNCAKCRKCFPGGPNIVFLKF
jgi:hypothetical protein